MVGSGFYEDQLQSVALNSALFGRESVKVCNSPSRRDDTFRCASLLKPLYAWAAYDLFRDDDNLHHWFEFVRPSVVLSDNETTTRYWNMYGAERLLSRLTEKTDTTWSYIEGYDTWGSVAISTRQVARAYSELVGSTESSARTVLGFMREVSNEQTFGVKQMVVDEYGVKLNSIAAKAGWFIDVPRSELHTHLVLIISPKSGDGSGVVVLSAKPVSQVFINDYMDKYSKGEEVLSLHSQLVGDDIRAEVRRLLIDRGVY